MLFHFHSEFPYNLLLFSLPVLMHTLYQISHVFYHYLLLTYKTLYYHTQ